MEETLQLGILVVLIVQTCYIMWGRRAEVEEEDGDLEVANPIGFERYDGGDTFFEEYDEGDFGIPDEEDD